MKALVTRVLDGVEVEPGFAAKLAQRKGLTPAQIRTAVRFAKLARTDGVAQALADGAVAAEASAAEASAHVQINAQTHVQTLIERQLGNADKALGRAASNKPTRRNVTTYDLDMLNVETRFEISKVIDALGRRGHGTLCFHGQPGTGKTALAEHIASALQKPLMIRQASDLVSKFVGETEQNMAKMFCSVSPTNLLTRSLACRSRQRLLQGAGNVLDERCLAGSGLAVKTQRSRGRGGPARR